MAAENSAGSTRSFSTGKGSSLLQVLRLRNFRLLWIGQAISLLGDQFHMIALPWLVLQLTGSALAMGTVLGLAGIPRALFMLLGGALTDRFSPRAVMLGSNLLRLALVTLLTGLVFTARIELWMLYPFALVFGLVDAFFYPAEGAVVPQLVEQEHLPAANALNQGTAQLSLFLAPVLAGALIAVLDGGQQAAGVVGAVPDHRGLAAAFGIDALTFLVSAITLFMVRINAPQQPASGPAEQPNVLASIRDGLVDMWHDPPLRIALLIVAAINLLVNGPFMVGIPVLAASRFPEGVAAFGMLMSAFGAGSLLGIVATGMLPKPAPERLGTTLMTAIACMGVGLALLGIVSNTALAVAISIAMGASNGYVFLTFMTWLQLRTPTAMLGRVMSLVMFAAVGLIPVSTAVAGALISLNASALFVTAGALVTLTVILAMLHPTVKDMGLEQRAAVQPIDP